jgi:hypothetical protein
MKGRGAVIELQGDYVCRWTDYSTLSGSRGWFRLLTFDVP